MSGKLSESEVTGSCHRLGFALSGVCAVSASAYAEEYLAWLRQGKHGTMEYLARNTEIRSDPERLLPGAKSAIMVADLYRERSGIGSTHERDPGSPPRGRIAKYAQGRDYHKVMKKRLHSLCDELKSKYTTGVFRAFVDTAPLMEREIAQLAGLGWIGKHTLLIHPRIGSYFLLGGILTTLDIEPTAKPISDHCGTCTRCIDACPTSAITPHSVDASRCISYLTIENRGPIAPEFRGSMADWLYGCDICQDVCPHNSARPDGAAVGEVNAEYTPRRDSFSLLEVLNWNEEDRQREFAGTAMTRATLAMMKRNAVILAANAIRTGCPEPHRSELLRRLTELASAHSDSPELASLAAQCLAGLRAG